MSALGPTLSAVLQRDNFRCSACRTEIRPLLTVHHMVPKHLGGSDARSNLTTLCANCHRLVHWLSAGDRADVLRARGLGLDRVTASRVLLLARRIKARRQRELGRGRVQTSSLSLAEALRALAERNGFDRIEAAKMRHCVRRIFDAMRTEERRACSRRLVRNALFMSVNAGNHLVARIPAWDDVRTRLADDLLLIWPRDVKPSIWSVSHFRRIRGYGFARIPYTNIGLSWDECLNLTAADWKLYQKACDDALNLVRTRSWASNVRLG